MDSKEALVALNMIEHVGPVRVRQLLEFFADAPAILHASKQQLLHVNGIGEETAEAISNWEKTVDLTGELQRIRDFGCHVLTQHDADLRVRIARPRSDHYFLRRHTGLSRTDGAGPRG